MTPKQTDEPEDESPQPFVSSDGTNFFPSDDIDDKAMWRIGNEIVSEEALLEFADDFDE